MTPTSRDRDHWPVQLATFIVPLNGCFGFGARPDFDESGNE
jgi:hypothetical protein